jgi:nickel-dependent lactate racemase
MRPDIRKAVKKVDMTGWKKVSLEFGRNAIEILMPPYCVELTMKDVPILSDPQKAIEEAFVNPINSPPLEEVVRRKGRPPAEMSVAIAVSDITRPVPYKGESGILPPLLI